MAKVIKLWQYQAMIEGLKALDEFEKSGSREGFKRWLKKYSRKGDKHEQQR